MMKKRETEREVSKVKKEVRRRMVHREMEKVKVQMLSMDGI